MTKRNWRLLVIVLILTFFSAWISLPEQLIVKVPFWQNSPEIKLSSPVIKTYLFGKPIYKKFELKEGLDIKGGMQVVLRADVSQIDLEDQERAVQSAREIIARRVDLYGVNEPVIQTVRQGDEYRIVVELAGVSDASEALQLLGSTAKLDFRLQSQEDLSPEATESAVAFFSSFKPTGLDGSMLKRSVVQYDQQGLPAVGLEFNEEGRKLFSEITSQNVGNILAIFVDDVPVTMPVIKDVVVNGSAIISGSFDVEEAQNLSIQLNAGALPVPIEILEQKTVGASLGQESVNESIRAGVIGLFLVMLFMALYYGVNGLIADLALLIYAVLTIAIYKLFGVVLTIPGIAGLILSIGMAVDANILIFERMKEELRLGRSAGQAMELGFGRAWDSIKDANLATIFTALILINPLDFTFLNTSGLVRGFGITLLIGVLISLFTGVVVSRNLMRLFLHLRHKS